MDQRVVIPVIVYWTQLSEKCIALMFCNCALSKFLWNAIKSLDSRYIYLYVKYWRSTQWCPWPDCMKSWLNIVTLQLVFYFRSKFFLSFQVIFQVTVFTIKYTEIIWVLYYPSQHNSTVDWFIDWSMYTQNCDIYSKALDGQRKQFSRGTCRGYFKNLEASCTFD